MMRHRSLLLTSVLTACCGLLLLAVPAHAQRRWSFSIQFERAEAERLLHRAQNRSAEFIGLFDQALDESSLSGTVREGRLNERARTLESELNMAREAFDRGEGSYEVTTHLSRAIDVAAPIDNVMINRRMTSEAEREWSLLRSDLNRLAAMYGVRQLVM